jgi:hypothetical protein
MLARMTSLAAKGVARMQTGAWGAVAIRSLALMHR